MKKIVASLDNIDSVAKYILETLPKSAVLILEGDLASGKTTLTKEIVKQKGSSDEVTSPTFSIQHIYKNGVFHYDMYRLEFMELVSLGIVDEFEKEGLHIVEWMNDDIKEALLEAGFSIFVVEIKPQGESREYTIYPVKKI